jgi:uncharacterized radical SAM superfamily Fe-S cluster-containing enzyme
VEDLSSESIYNYGLYEAATQRTCLIILDITQQCNANCSVCIADTPFHKSVPPLTTDQVKTNLSLFLREVGTKPPIQLSGGEPTVHGELIPILELIRHMGFDSLEMNTNGLLLAEKPELAQQLKDAGLTGVFLQFDSLTPTVYEKLRGRDVLRQKIEAIENCQKADLPIVLQPTVVKNINDNEIWNIVRFAVNAGVAGVDFLPFTPTGKLPPWGENPLERLTIADIMLGIENQSKGEISAADLYSVPCPDSRCTIITYTLIRQGKLIPLTRLVDFSEVKEDYGKLVEWETILNDLEQKNSTQSCSSSCCGTPRYDLRADGYFVIGCHGFQDQWNFDVERAKLCCFHELTPKGKLVPFCYYSMVRNQWNHPHPPA